MKNTQTPTTLVELLNKTSHRIWSNPKHLSSSYNNVAEAVKIMGKPLLSEITTTMIDDYTQVISKKLKPASVNRKLSSLHTLLKYAYDREWIDKIPKFTWSREDNERIRWLSQDEEKQLLSLLPEDISAFCEVLIHTGMRRGELLTLQRDQIDGDYLRLWKTKTKRARSVPLTPRAKELVTKWAPFNLNVWTIQDAWLKAKKQMGLENDPSFVLHTLRHTTATRVLQSTNNIAIVQKVLGHSKITTTMRYAHVSDETLLNAVKLASN